MVTRHGATLLVCFLVQACAVQGIAPVTAPVKDTSRMYAEKAPQNIADLRALEKRVQRVIRDMQACTVKVGGGTGVIISPDGYVLTVAHLANKAGRTMNITFADGRQVKGETLGSNHGVDAGLVKITDEGEWPHAEMGDSERLVEGQWCIAMGYPVSFSSGKPPAVRVGRVIHNRNHAIMSDCVIMGGDSGGPLFDLDGKVIGISSRCDDELFRNLHVPINAYRDGWDRLARGEVWNPEGPNGPFLGVAPVEHSGRAKLGHVVPDSAAESAGLRVGDLVLSFNGEEIDDFAHLSNLIRKRKPGDQVTIKVRRKDETIDVTATLGQRGR